METLKPAKTDKGLSSKQLAYANHVLNGKTQANAYILAYGKPLDYNLQNARSAGQKLYNSKTIQSYLRLQTKKAERKAGLSLADRFEILAQIATDENNSPDTRIRCIDVYNKMSGDNGSQKIEINGVFSNNPSKQLTVRDKIDYLRKARELRKVNETVEDVRQPFKTTKSPNKQNEPNEDDPLSPASAVNRQGNHLPLIEIESHNYE